MTQKITALICTRNGARKIEDAIRSLVAQEDIAPEQYEIIVVDNGSTDDTVAICEALLSEVPIRSRIVREPTPGQVFAQYRGFRLARGEIVTLIDDDNVVCKDFLATVIALFEDNPDVGMIASNNAYAGPTPPEWFDGLAGRFACTPPRWQGQKLRDAGPGCTVYDLLGVGGAGCCFRLRPLMDAIDRGFFFILGSHRPRLPYLVGHDMEMALLFKLLGWRFLYCENLKLLHYIDPSRLTAQAAMQLAWTQATSTLGIELLLRQEAVGAQSIRASWIWLVSVRFKRMLQQMRLFVRQRGPSEVDRFHARFLLRYEVAAFWFFLVSFGHLNRLARLRAMSPWTQLHREQYPVPGQPAP